ncbi:hypothetical protein VCHA54P489_120081 [Vibrio chagasii]|nr:hypothetical protein VCHA30O60_10479 [Vibrio chagasii]CAH6914739.1 hypothetical protein VCHA54P489_120081 [Vibrio chagasii]CAH6918677.1 hypothetical protein VCHA49P380_110080 [Vibrio chagasii]CAH6927433.1 hypothetical protein VCHA37P202_100084 [Vibrio chagasii]
MNRCAGFRAYKVVYWRNENGVNYMELTCIQIKKVLKRMKLSSAYVKYARDKANKSPRFQCPSLRIMYVMLN